MKQSKKGTNKNPGRKTMITSTAIESKQEARTQESDHMNKAIGSRNNAGRGLDRIKHSEGKQTRAKDTGVQMH